MARMARERNRAVHQWEILLSCGVWARVKLGAWLNQVRRIESVNVSESVGNLGCFGLPFGAPIESLLPASCSRAGKSARAEQQPL